VLPIFEVIIKTDRHITHDQGKILVEVSAKTTYGKLIDGLATIRAIRKDNNKIKELKEIDVKEKVNREFHLVNDLGITKHDNNIIVKIEVSFEEELTGRTQNASTEIQIHIEEFNMEMITFSNSFKPHSWFTFFVKVADFDGNPIQNFKNKGNKVSANMVFTDKNGAVTGNFSHVASITRDRGYAVFNFFIAKKYKSAEKMTIQVSL
jgi:hypothetical protein